MEYLIHFCVAIVLAVLSSVGGGGGGLIMTPYLLLWGIPPTVVLGSGKFAGLGLSVASTIEFHKKNMIRTDLAKKLMLLVFVASFIGAQVALSVDESLLETAIGFAVMFISLSLLVMMMRGMGLEPKQTKKKHKGFGYIAYFINSTFQAALGAGVGMFNTFILISGFGLTALQSLAVKRLVNMVGLITASAVFIAQGSINWTLALTLLGGYFIGSRIGTQIAIRKGNRFVMSMQVGIGLVMATVLLVR